MDAGGAAESLKAIGIDLGGWCRPARGPDAERVSLFVQHRGLRRLPPLEDAGVIEEKVAALYPATVTGWAGGVDAVLSDSSRVRRILSSVKPDSSPGVPWSSWGKTNADILDGSVHETALSLVVRERVKRLIEISPDDLEGELRKDPLWAIRNGLSDPVRVFVKSELHPQRKALSGKWRLINSVSVADQIVEKLIFSNQDDAEKAVWASIPSKPGMGLTDDDFKSLTAYAEQNGLTVGSDASGFDVTVPEFLVRMEERCRIRLALDPTMEWVRAVRNFNTLMVRRVIVLSDGQALCREVPGGMISGRACTASSNSRMRGLIHATCALRCGVEPAFMTMGDDCVERKTMSCEELVKFVRETFGVVLTDVAEELRGISFCSHLMDGSIGIPQNPEKQIAKYLLNPTEETFMQLKSNLRHHPRLAEVERILGSVLADVQRSQ